MINIPEDYLIIKNSVVDTLGYLPNLGVEVGVREGFLSYTLLKHIDCLTMYSVDLWGPHPLIEESHDHEYNYNLATKLLSEFGDRSIVKRELSHIAVKEIKDNSLDFVIIDATHTYKAVLQDIQEWTPKVKDSGWLFGHDYVAGWQPVIDAVQKSVKSKKDIVLLPCTYWAVQKKNIIL